MKTARRCLALRASIKQIVTQSYLSDASYSDAASIAKDFNRVMLLIIA
jgi:hypothetical protein